MEKTNERLKTYAERNRQSRRAVLMEHRKKAKAQTMTELMNAATASARKFEEKQAKLPMRVSSANTKAGKQTRRAFYKHLRKVVEAADVIVEVLDARDPLVSDRSCVCSCVCS